MRKQHKAFFDGGATPNPGIMKIGGYIQDHQREEIFSYSKTLAHGTNNEAEYISIKIGLDRVLSIINEFPISILTIYGDSLLVIKQLKGEYRVKSPNLKPYYQSVMSQIDQIKMKKVKIFLKHVKRDKNKIADQLANLAIDMK